MYCPVAISTATMSISVSPLAGVQVKSYVSPVLSDVGTTDAVPFPYTLR